MGMIPLFRMPRHFFLFALRGGPWHQDADRRSGFTRMKGMLAETAWPATYWTSRQRLHSVVFFPSLGSQQALGVDEGRGKWYRRGSWPRAEDFRGHPLPPRHSRNNLSLWSSQDHSDSDRFPTFGGSGLKYTKMLQFISGPPSPRGPLWRPGCI